MSSSHMSASLTNATTMVFTSASSYPAASAASHTLTACAASCPAISRSPSSSFTLQISVTISATIGVSAPTSNCSAARALRRVSSASRCSPCRPRHRPSLKFTLTAARSAASPFASLSIRSTNEASPGWLLHAKKSAMSSRYTSGVSTPSGDGGVVSASLSYSATRSRRRRGGTLGGGTIAPSGPGTLFVDRAFAAEISPFTSASQRLARSTWVSSFHSRACTLGSVRWHRRPCQASPLSMFQSTSHTPLCVGSKLGSENMEQSLRCCPRRSAAVLAYRLIAAAASWPWKKHKTGSPGSLSTGQQYGSSSVRRLSHSDGGIFCKLVVCCSNQRTSSSRRPARDAAMSVVASATSVVPYRRSNLSNTEANKSGNVSGKPFASSAAAYTSPLSLTLALISFTAARRYRGDPASSLATRPASISFTWICPPATVARAELSTPTRSWCPSGGSCTTFARLLSWSFASFSALHPAEDTMTLTARGSAAGR